MEEWARWSGSRQGRWWVKIRMSSPCYNIISRAVSKNQCCLAKMNEFYPKVWWWKNVVEEIFGLSKCLLCFRWKTRLVVDREANAESHVPVKFKFLTSLLTENYQCDTIRKLPRYSF